MYRVLLAALSVLSIAVCGCGQEPSLQALFQATGTADAVDGNRDKKGGMKWETVVVTPAQRSGWAFQVVDPQGDPTGQGSLVAGPASPPLGIGSAHLSSASDGGQGVFLSNSDYAKEKLSDLTALSYSTYATAWNGQQLPYLKVDLDLDHNGSIDDYLFFEPAYQTHTSGNPSLPDQGRAALDTWQTWDALVGGWWSACSYANATPGTGVKPLSDYLALFPKAGIVNLPNGDGGVRLVVGLASASDIFRGYVDNVAIAFKKKGTLFDFEPAP